MNGRGGDTSSCGLLISSTRVDRFPAVSIFRWLLGKTEVQHVYTMFKVHASVRELPARKRRPGDYVEMHLPSFQKVPSGQWPPGPAAAASAWWAGSVMLWVSSVALRSCNSSSVVGASTLALLVWKLSCARLL